jgi:serine protease Do
MKRPLHTLLFLFGLFSILTAHADSSLLQNSNHSIAPLLQKVMPAVVNIYAEGDSKGGKSPFAGKEFQQQPQPNGPEGSAPPALEQNRNHFASIGSGVIVDAKHGYILTNAHVIYEADNITVTLNDGRRYKAQPLGMDTGFDVALLQISANNLNAIALGDSSGLRVGDFVTAIGSPFDLKQTATSGIVSALHRSLKIEGNEDFIQTDASINIGSSGGALINMNGQLVGINTAILAPDGGNIGIGFAIPINLATKVMDQLVKFGKLERGMLGVLIQDLTPDLAESFSDTNAHGALVSQVNPFSPAQLAGLKEGDIIVNINGTPTNNSSDVVNNISLLRPGTAVSVSAVRSGAPMVFHANLISNKDFKKRMVDHNVSLLAGVSLENFEQQTLNYGHVKGVQAVYVDPNSDAWSGMLRPGDVITSANHKPVGDIASLDDAVKRNPNKLLLHILRADGGGFYLTIP